MIISQLDGGLGNQMFEYASGLLVAKRNDAEFFVDPGYLLAFRFHQTWNRNPDILDMCLAHGVASKKDIGKFIFSTGISTIDMYLRRLGFFDRNTYRFSPDGVMENKIGDNTYLSGFISGDIFDSIKDELGKEFHLKDEKKIKGILNQVRKNKSVSIHMLGEGIF